MRVLVQRSGKSEVVVEEKVVGAIEKGLVILVCFTEGDNEEIIDKMVKKIINLRIFDDENGIMNKSIIESGGNILSVSQFTLYADTKKGNRPSYFKALSGDKAISLYDLFNKRLREYVEVATGIFGAYMRVNITNDGPTTILLEY